MELSKIDIIEGLLYIAGDSGLHEKTLIEHVPITKEQLEKTIETYNKSNFIIDQHGSMYYLKTTNAMSKYIERVLESAPKNKLSNAALEVLAIIAYNQPVARGMIEELRGVSPDGPLNTLLSKNLIERVHFDEDRRTFFKTSQRFLEVFDLKSIDELPTAETIEEQEHIDLFFSNLEGEME